VAGSFRVQAPSLSGPQLSHPTSLRIPGIRDSVAFHVLTRHKKNLGRVADCQTVRKGACSCLSRMAKSPIGPSQVLDTLMSVARAEQESGFLPKSQVTLLWRNNLVTVYTMASPLWFLLFKKKKRKKETRCSGAHLYFRR
jgi:hypothetical protein